MIHITHSLDKTNPRLTGNIKLVVDPEDNFYIESINSSEQLSMSRFKGYEFNDDLTYGANIRNFCRQFVDIDNLWTVKKEESINITNQLYNQYHQLYDYGCYSEESQIILENFRFFAPIYIGTDKNEFPDKFVILKTSSEKKTGETFSTLIDTSTIVNVFDLTKLQKKCFNQIEQSFIDMSYVDTLMASGLNVSSGLYNRVEELVFQQLIDNETTISEFDNWLTNAFRRHQLIYSNIVNVEFAFTDTVVDNKFVRYAGFYVKSNEITKTVADSYKYSGALTLLRKELGHIKYDASITQLLTYNRQAFSAFANSFGTINRKQIEFKFLINPAIGSSLQIIQDNVIEHQIVFSGSMIGVNSTATKQLIVDSINLQYQGNDTTIRAQILDNGSIRLTSNIAGDFGELRLVVPAGFIVKPPKFFTSFNNQFIGSDAKTISVNNYISPIRFNKMAYRFNGQQIVSEIVRVTEYNGDYLYQLADTILHDNYPDNVWFVETLTEQPILCSILEHRELDMSIEQTQYNDPLDFDIVKYRQYLLDTVNASDFVGSAAIFSQVDPVDLTSEMIESYRDVLIEKINLFFDSISLNTEYLINQIDMSNYEATIIDNEYNRLRETENINQAKSNRLYQFINKWSHDKGPDVYNNDYRLNIALPFRYDSFSTSTKSIERDLRYHTHSWFIIGEGRPPYYPVNETYIKKLMSYSKYPLTEALLADTQVDAFIDMFRWTTESGQHDAWSIIYYDPEQNACYTMFKGMQYKFETSQFKDYRFAIVLKSSVQIVDDVFTLKLIQNEQFKTLTLYINFYIPDPILTSLERGLSWYYLDRSLLYFSDEIYASSQNAIDFGTDRVSLRLYDTSQIKKYLGQDVTSNWFYQTTDGPILWVGRGDTSIFNVNFNAIIQIGDTFVIDLQSVTNNNDDQSVPQYSMRIQFEDIVEVQADAFWCKRIIVKTVLTTDPQGIDDQTVDDNIVNTQVALNIYDEFVLNNNLFNDNNIAYISKAIAFENCIYRKIVNNSANNARYKEISLANIATLLSYQPVQINGQQNFVSIFVIEPKEFRALIKLSSSGEQLELLPIQYTYPMSRFSGQYKPQTRLLTRQYDSNGFKMIYPSIIKNSMPYRAIVSKIVGQEQMTHASSRYDMFSQTTNNISAYEFIKAVTANSTAYATLPWICFPSEFRQRYSLVFNSDEKITVTTTVSEQINLVDVLLNRVKQWTDMTTLLTEDVRELFTNLLYDVTSQTYSNIDIERAIADSFIVKVFLKIYRIEQITKLDGQIVQYTISNSSITPVIEQGIVSGEQIEIKFTR